MTPTEIAALSDHELKWEIAVKLGWRNLQRVELPGGGDGIKGTPPDTHDYVAVPDWSRDPAASAALRLELWKRGLAYMCMITTTAAFADIVPFRDSELFDEDRAVRVGENEDLIRRR